MRKSICVLGVFLLFTGFAFGLSEGAGGLSYTIAVSKFENRSNFSGQFSISDTFTAILTDSLHQTGKFVVLGEKDMRKEAMGEQDFGESGRVAKGGKTPATGYMTPAQLLVKGEITHFQHSTTGGDTKIRIKGFNIGGGTDHAEINVVVYVIDSTTGQVISSKKVMGKASRSGVDVGYADKDWGADLGGFKKTNVGKAVEKAVDEAVKFIAEQTKDLPWTASVVMVKEGGLVYINRGSREGIKTGMEFNVGSAEDVRDPDTGELLESVFEKKATVVVQTVKEKLTICKIAEGGGDIEKGMTVRLPE